MEGNYYNAGRQLRRDATSAPVKDSDFKMRKVAAALFGIIGMDATPEQLDKARKAVAYFNQGKPVSLILLLLRIKPTKPAATVQDVEHELNPRGERISL